MICPCTQALNSTLSLDISALSATANVGTVIDVVPASTEYKVCPRVSNCLLNEAVVSGVDFGQTAEAANRTCNWGVEDDSPVCGVCEDGWIMRSSGCTKCANQDQAMVLLWLGGVVALLLLLTAAVYSACIRQYDSVDFTSSLTSPEEITLPLKSVRMPQNVMAADESRDHPPPPGNHENELHRDPIEGITIELEHPGVISATNSNLEAKDGSDLIAKGSSEHVAGTAPTTSGDNVSVSAHPMQAVGVGYSWIVNALNSKSRALKIVVSYYQIQVLCPTHSLSVWFHHLT